MVARAFFQNWRNLKLLLNNIEILGTETQKSWQEIQELLWERGFVSQFKKLPFGLCRSGLKRWYNEGKEDLGDKNF